MIQFEFDKLVFTNPEEAKDFKFNQNYFDNEFAENKKEDDFEQFDLRSIERQYQGSID